VVAGAQVRSLRPEAQGVLGADMAGEAAVEPAVSTVMFRVRVDKAIPALSS